MATSDITFQDFKHPYLLALVRWCVSSFWTTATVILHRLITAPLPPNTGIKPPKPRPATSDHLHPDPRVECVVLHEPQHPTIDVIFVHGLYGSLANTWRQGEWMPKYGKSPNKVPLRRPHSISTCKCADETGECGENNKDNDKNNDRDVNNEKEKENDEARDNLTRKESEIQVSNIYNDIQKILPNNDIFITDKFYNNTLLDQESDGQKNEQNIKNNCDRMILPKDNLFITENFYTNPFLNHENYETQAQFVQDLFKSDMKDNENSEINETNEECNDSDVTNSDATPKVSECKCTDCVGCGCICDECYSPCWPRDWVRVDYPGARIISINYTSDPYLWRPLWVKEIKRLRLHVRAEQMMSQLLDLGVGDRPIIWVGHSKGGLFIKQMYCEAYEAHLKIQRANGKNEQNTTECYNDNIFNHCIDNRTDVNCDINDNESNDNNASNDNEIYEVNGNHDSALNNSVINSDSDSNNTNNELTLEMDDTQLQKRASLWTNSSGFMFYSVPHRGSPLADIKTPITARSIELMEICKVKVSGSAVEEGTWHAAALDAWALLLLLLEPHHAKALLTEKQPSISRLADLLNACSLEVRLSAGGALVSAHERTDDDHWPEYDDLLVRLQQLTRDSHKYRAKRDRKLQRATFRDILRYFEEGTVEELKVRIGVESIVLDGWGSRAVYGALAAALSAGLVALAPHSPPLRAALGLNEPPPTPGHAQAKLNKLQRNLQNAAACKARTVARNKSRDKRSAALAL